MNKKEQDMLRKLRQKTDDIAVPENVKPDRIRQTLEKRYESGKNRRKVSIFRIGVAAAACLVIVAGIAVYRNGAAGQKITSPDRKIPEISSERTVASAADYEEVYEYIENYKKELEEEQRAYEEEIAYESAMESGTGMAEAKSSGSSEMMSADTDMAAAADTGDGNYSETNVRQEGVDEGDVVKTDGTYLYVLRDSRDEVSVVDTRGGKMKEAGSIKIEKNGNIQEIYLDTAKKQLVLVRCRYDDEGLTKRAYSYSGMTEVLTYDITDPEKPQEAGRVTQSGYYQSSRMSEGYLYLFTNYGVDWDIMERSAPETYIPLVNDAVIAEKDICLPAVKKGREFTIAASVNMRYSG